MISLAPVLVGGLRSYVIVFSSNAPDPKLFNGVKGTLGDDGNSEIWIYRVPAVGDVDLTLGIDFPVPLDLTTGQFFQVTNTPASRLPTPGGIGEDGLGKAPTFADDNREPSI